MESRNGGRSRGRAGAVRRPGSGPRPVSINAASTTETAAGAPVVVEATIGSMAYGGRGVARVDGMVVFVPNTAPGDRSRIRITQKHRTFADGEVETLLDPGPSRRVPPCPYYETCGGCQLMHMSYQAQLEAKQSFVADGLRRIGAQTIEPAKTVGSADEFRYRRRAMLRGERTGEKRLLGFFRRETHAVVDIPHCEVLYPPLAVAIDALRDLFRAAADPGHDLEFKINAISDGNGRIHLTVHGARRDADFLYALVESLRSSFGTAYHLLDETGATLFESPDSQRYSYELKIAGGRTLKYEFAPGAFTQIHFEQNQKLVDLVLEMVGPARTGRILDLYCGIGNYTLALGPSAAEIVGVESSPSAVDAARANAQREGINARFERDTAARMIRKLRESKAKFDAVLLNPTRAGAEGVLPDLIGIAPERIVYVSCDPTTLARDVAILAKAGYRLDRVVPMDLFPQTYHVESVALLTRVNGREQS